MSSTSLFLIFIPLLSLILLAINLTFAPHNAYQEKNSAFECGFHSFLGQNRTQFSISFFIFALLFLLFDLEILLVYPYTVSAYTNDIYGLITMLIFFLVLTLGFVFELGKNALNLDTRQILNFVKKLIKAVIKKSTILLFYTCILITYFLVHLFVILLVNKGIIDLPDSFFEHCLPLENESQSQYQSQPQHLHQHYPLDCYPEYKQINNLQEINNVKQQLLNIKQEYLNKLAFNRPETYQRIVEVNQKIYDENICTIQDPSFLHPHVSYAHQSDWLKNVLSDIEQAKKEYILKTQQFQENNRILAECNHRIIAASTRINQLGGCND